MKYLDHLPRIPEDLISEIYLCLGKENIFERENSPYYKVYRSNQKIKDWIYSFFDQSYTVRIQTIKNGINPHIDFNRKVAYNYIIDTGGKDACLCYFLPTYESFKIEEHRWHKLDVSRPHSVEGINDMRISITVHKKDESY